MQFHIEIVRDIGGNIEIVYRATVDEMSADRAKTKADALLISTLVGALTASEF